MLRSFPLTSSAVRYSNFVKIFQKCRSHLKILGAARFTQCKIHTDEPETLGNHSTKLFVTGFWHPEFGHPCITDWLPYIATLYSTTWTATLKEILSAFHPACYSFHYSVCMSCLTLLSRTCSFNILCACLVSLSRITCPSVKYRKIFSLFFTFYMACWVHWYLCR